MRLFLDEIYDRRLKVLNCINNRGHKKNIKEIAKETNLANRTVSMILKQFEQELDVPNTVFKMEYVNKTIKSVSANNLDLNSIGRSYLLQSTMYKVIKYIFLYDKLDVNKFCEAEFISAPTFSRYRKRLKNILQQCGLDISRENRIIGDEFRIRNFFFLFFSNASNVWEFAPQEYLEIENYFSTRFSQWKDMDSLKQLKFVLIIYIGVIRSRKKNFAKNDELINSLEKHKEARSTALLLDYCSLGKNKTTRQTKGEASATLFFLYKEQLISENVERRSYEDYFSEEVFSFVADSHRLTVKLINEFFDGSENEELFLNVRREVDLIYLVMHICFIDHKIFYYVYDEKNFYYTDPMEQVIKEKLAHIFKELGVFENRELKKFKQEDLLNYMYLAIYSLQTQFKITTYEPVKIFIQNTKNFVPDIIRGKVSPLFGDRIDCVDKLTPQVDIVVTDVKLPDKGNLPHQVYVTTFSDYDDITFLIEQIQTKLLENYNKREMHLQKLEH
ncbi:helix-turn-helix domain-containing protein [Enterococcus rotai]|uniref:helix-turn-helix domain-containing protein n=1 Tax=Enterococcus rotai TaxID=118060 RepID=UPI0032B5B127